MNRVYGMSNLLRLAKAMAFICVLVGCGNHKDSYTKTETRLWRIDQADFSSKTHFRNNDYILSIDSEIGNPLVEGLKRGSDSVFLKQDTIDIQLLHPYWSAMQIRRVLSSCAEKKEIEVFWCAHSTYIHRMKRTTPKTAFEGIHRFYVYTNPESKDTILSSYSFDTGTPPF
jgi:hypothetical protein